MKKELTTLFTGRHYTVLEEIDSTNSFLAGILRNKILPEGAAIRTEYQKAGRGQAGVGWESESGKNLLISLAFYPGFVSPKEVFLLNKTYALAVYDFAENLLGSNVRIKWPNDVYWNDKKLGGILVENAIYQSALSYSILGVGLNVNQVAFSPALPNPVSFAMIKGIEYDLDELFNSLCGFIEARYLQLKRGDLFRIDEDYLSALYKMNEWIRFRSNSQEYAGCIRGVSENGKLIIEKESGQVVDYDIKEVKYVL